MSIARQTQLLQSEAVVLAQAGTDSEPLSGFEGFQQQVHQAGVTDQQSRLMGLVQVQSFERGQQQTEQLKFLFHSQATEEFNTAMQDLLDALASFIGDP